MLRRLLAIPTYGNCLGSLAPQGANKLGAICNNFQSLIVETTFEMSTMLIGRRHSYARKPSHDRDEIEPVQ
jgi:hypothetical protein